MPNLGTAFYHIGADEKYPLLNRDNLTIPIEMQLSQKQKTFYQFFAVFLKSRLNSTSLGKKDDPHRFCISEITTSKNVVRKMSNKSHFRRRFDKEYGKRPESLLKFPLQDIYPIK